jgi:S-DNA-T family DNA segregation ATPase FtsK/SpoIIIE
MLDELREKIKGLERRITILEKKLNKKEGNTHNIWMDQLYNKAKDLVIKNQKASVWFLQRKLLIDYERAVELIEMLEKEGIIGPETSQGRKVIESK